jgi:cytochrome b561
LNSTTNKRRKFEIHPSNKNENNEGPMNNTSATYTKTAIWLHWAIAALMIVMLIFGEDMIRHATDTFYPSLHASLGISILVLTCVRLWWRLTHKAPALPTTMKGWEVSLSHLTHYAFYALMILLPLSGLMSFTSESARETILTGTTLFGIFPVPALPNVGGIGGGLHGLASKLGQALVILHVLAALKHQFWDKDGLMRRMSPH